jgi:hypothetical protein
MKGSKRTNLPAGWDPDFCSADPLFTSIRTGFYRSTFTERTFFPSLSPFAHRSHESVSLTSSKFLYTPFNRSDTDLIQRSLATALLITTMCTISVSFNVALYIEFARSYVLLWSIPVSFIYVVHKPTWFTIQYAKRCPAVCMYVMLV